MFNYVILHYTIGAVLRKDLKNYGNFWMIVVFGHMTYLRVGFAPSEARPLFCPTSMYTRHAMPLISLSQKNREQLTTKSKL